MQSICIYEFFVVRMQGNTCLQALSLLYFDRHFYKVFIEFEVNRKDLPPNIEYEEGSD